MSALDYRVERSGRKTLRAQIEEDGTILVKAPYWVADRQIEAFLDKHRDKIKALQAKAIEQMRYYYLYGDRYERDGVDVEAIWLEQMRAYVIPRAWELARRFGDRPRAIKVSKAKKRWGSCSSSGRINLSFRLAQLPKDLIDYVIIHELAHLHHLNHSPAFWALVERRCPDFRKKEMALKNF